MSNNRPRPNYLLLLILALMARGAISLGQTGWQASPHPVKLERIPAKIESWQATELKMDRDARDLLSPDAYLWRRYDSKQDAPVEMLVVYGHSKNTFHSPGFCLPGSGWQVVEKRQVQFDYGQGRLAMTLFHIQKGRAKQLVLFSFLAGNRSTASLYRHNWNLLVDRVFHRSSGGALVRLVVPMKSEKEALEAARRFARMAFPPLRTELAGSGNDKR